ncbi:MAG: DUF5131 family protein [Methanotrichaceae archaeon]|nr:DUF5131 family protein [Methanotrichaceae archaeon]
MNRNATENLNDEAAKAPQSFIDGMASEHIQERAELKIDEEFQFLIPAISEEEYLQLEQNILEYGCIDPIVTWENTILDGHNRYKICGQNEIEYKIHPIALDNRVDAIDWIIDHQLGRRNLTDSQKSYLIGKRYNTEKKVAYRPKKADHSDQLITSEKIAQESKVGSATVRRDAKFAAAIDSLKDDAGPEFSKKLLSGEIKLSKKDVIKLAEKPIEEKEALLSEIQNGAKRLSQAEIALQSRIESQNDTFESAGSDIEFAAWSWDVRKLEAPRNTSAPLLEGPEKQRLVYLKSDIFAEGFPVDETEKVLQVMRESPQWIFMVHTERLERLEETDWPFNVLIGCVVDSQDKAEHSWEYFEAIRNVNKFVICDLHKESIVFDGLYAFNWIIIRNPSKVQPEWQRVESILEQARADGLWIYWMPNVTVRPRDYPRRLEQETGSQLEVVATEPAQMAA